SWRAAPRTSAPWISEAHEPSHCVWGAAGAAPSSYAKSGPNGGSYGGASSYGGGSSSNAGGGSGGGAALRRETLGASDVDDNDGLRSPERLNSSSSRARTAAAPRGRAPCSSAAAAGRGAAVLLPLGRRGASLRLPPLPPPNALPSDSEAPVDTSTGLNASIRSSVISNATRGSRPTGRSRLPCTAIW